MVESSSRSSYQGLGPEMGTHTVVVERSGLKAMRAKRKSFSRMAAGAMCLIGVAALTHRMSTPQHTQYLADAPADTVAGVSADMVAADAAQNANKAGENLSTGFRENWVGMTEAMAVILAAEIGDKSFFVAIILAMKYDKWLVLMASMLALSIMSICSAAFGGLISQIDNILLQWAAAITYLIFGAMMLYDGYYMEEDHSNLEEAREELENEGLVEKEEQGLIKSETTAASSAPISARSSSRLKNWEVVTKVFMLMFVAEMGDRTMIAMIVLSTRHDPAFVCVGSIVGFLVVTTLAVLCGEFLTGKVSERFVTIFGGVLFLIFAGFTFLQAGHIITSDF